MKVKKFWEDLGYGRVSNRVGYAADIDTLPAATTGSEWREDKKFDERVEVSDHPNFQQVIDAVHNEGCAIVLKAV